MPPLASRLPQPATACQLTGHSFKEALVLIGAGDLWAFQLTPQQWFVDPHDLADGGGEAPPITDPCRLAQLTHMTLRQQLVTRQAALGITSALPPSAGDNAVRRSVEALGAFALGGEQPRDLKTLLYDVTQYAGWLDEQHGEAATGLRVMLRRARERVTDSAVDALALA